MPHIKKRLLILCLSAATALGGVQGVYASSVPEAEQKRSEAEEGLQSVTEEIERIKERQEALREEIDSMDEEIMSILIETKSLEEDISDTEAELGEAQTEFRAAKEKEDEYLEGMSTRISYMYENGGMSFLESMVDSGSMAESLSKVEKFKTIYDADREMLKEYQEAREEAEAIAEGIEAGENELKERKAELKDRQAELEESIEEKYGESEECADELKEMEDLAAEYQSTISQMNSAIAAASGSYGTVSSSGTANGQTVADYAQQFLGNSYKWGGTSLTNGCDCSGFVVSVYAHFGISLPHYSGSLRSVGTAVSASDMQPGDIVCYSGHVGIYVGNGQIISAANPKPYPAGGIKYTSAYYKSIITVRRIFV